MIYLGLNLKDYDEFPSLTDTSWKSAHEGVFQNSDARILMNELPSEGGLYYLWLKGSGTGIKTVYGQSIIEVGTVTKIEKEDKKDENNGSKGNNNQKQETPSSTATKKDTTTATYKTLPNTGLSVALIGGILLVIVGGVALLAKYHKYRDVK